MSKTFVGFGFGPIQSGLFLYEAYRSCKFDRLVVAEVAENVVDSVRKARGTYAINIANSDGICRQTVKGVEILNPLNSSDQVRLVKAIATCDELATALPSVDFYDRGEPSPASLLSAGLIERKPSCSSQNTLIYAAENHNCAAQILSERVRAKLNNEQQAWLGANVQFANTVIGKMSGVVDDPTEIARAHLQPMVADASPAILVEEFNRILIDRIQLPGISRGITVFEEKSNLLPFEEAKLYGHNAAHALMGYLAHRKGLQFMSEANIDGLLDYVRAAFLNESGTTLCKRHRSVDPLFTENGWTAYVTDLLERMTNPFLRDKVDRVVRDPGRKLGWNDRLVGCIRLALQHNVRPTHYLVGAAAALGMLFGSSGTEGATQALQKCWSGTDIPQREKEQVISLIMQAYSNLEGQC